MGENDGWRAQLPETQRDNEAFTGFEKIGDFAEDYLSVKGNASELQGKLDNSIPKLNDNPTAEETAAYFKSIGRPDDVNGYDIQKPELPEGLPYSDEVVGQFKEAALALNMTPTQAQGLFKWYMDGTVNAHKVDAENRSKSVTEAETALKTEYGADYSANLELMKRAVEKFGGEEFIKHMDDTGLGNNPMIIKTFVNIGKAMSEDTLVLGDKGADGLTRGPDGRVVFDYPASPGMKK